MQFAFNRLKNRALWIKIHIYSALVLGLIFAMTGLTGSLSVYRDEIDELLNPDLVIPAQNTPLVSPDKMLAAVRKAHPHRNGVWTLEMPRSAHGAVTFWFDKPQEAVDKLYAPLMVAVNPYTGEVISSRFWGQTFTTWMLDLHTQLQMEAFGRKAMAVIAVFLFMSVLSGLYLWWPGWGLLTSAFTVRSDSGLLRWLFDQHRLLGLISAGLLLLLAFTGFHLAYPPLLETLTASAGMGHDDAGPNVHSSGVPNNRPVGLTEAVLVARGLFPSSEVRRISTPLGELGTYRINLRQHHEINQHHPMTNVWIDRWSGQIRDVRNPVKFSAGQSFTAWLWPLHTGEAVGSTGKFIWFLTGLTPLLLYISGLWHWLYRKGIAKDRQLDFPRLRQKMLAVSLQGILFCLKLAGLITGFLLKRIAEIRNSKL